MVISRLAPLLSLDTTGTHTIFFYRFVITKPRPPTMAFYGHELHNLFVVTVLHVSSVYYIRKILQMTWLLWQHWKLAVPCNVILLQITLLPSVICSLQLLLRPGLLWPSTIKLHTSLTLKVPKLILKKLYVCMGYIFHLYVAFSTSSESLFFFHLAIYIL